MASSKSPVLYFIVTQLKTYSYIQSMNHKKEFKYLRTWHKACVDCCFAAIWPWSHNLSLWNHSKVHQPRVKHQDMSHEIKAVVQIPQPLGQQRCQMPRGDVEALIWPIRNIIDNYWIKLTVNGELFGRGHICQPSQVQQKSSGLLC